MGEYETKLEERMEKDPKMKRLFEWETSRHDSGMAKWLLQELLNKRNDKKVEEGTSEVIEFLSREERFQNDSERKNMESKLTACWNKIKEDSGATTDRLEGSEGVMGDVIGLIKEVEREVEDVEKAVGSGTLEMLGGKKEREPAEGGIEAGVGSKSVRRWFKFGRGCDKIIEV